MLEATQLSEAKRRLLSKYLSGNRSGAIPSVAKLRAPGPPSPLSLAQEQIWVNAQRTGVPPFYNESITIHRRGLLDRDVVERCIVEIVRRHEAWRTTFDVRDGKRVQIVHPAPASISLPLTDLRSLPESERGERAQSLAKADVERPFDLRNGPLFRASVFRLGDQEYRLYVAAHQIIIDGVSAYQVFLPELVALYEAFSQDKASPLAEPPIQYADFARCQHERLSGEVLTSEMNFWRKELQGEIRALQWPQDGPRPAKSTYRGTIRPFTVPAALSRELNEFSRREGVTLFVTLLTGFFALLHCYTNQDDLILGTVSPAGRKQPEAQRLMGYFLNPVPLRADLSNDPTIHELLAQIHRVRLGALSHDEVPFEHLVDALKPATDPSRNPFFTVAASLEPHMPEVDPAWNLTPMDIENGGGRWDLYLVWDDRPNGMIGRVQYNPDILKAATVTRMLKDQEIVLNEIVCSPGKHLSELSLASRGLAALGDPWQEAAVQG